MQILRAADRIAKPWKNGGGLTREVIAWPPGSSFEDFHWRISMAEVRTDGPFSVFKNVDRILTVLEGDLSLSVDGGEWITQSPQSAPFPFAGDLPVMAHVEPGAVVDLNVMTRRSAASAIVERMHVAGTLNLPSAAFMRVLFSRCTLQVHEPAIAGLGCDDAVLLEAEGPPVTLSTTHGTLFLITFHPAV